MSSPDQPLQPRHIILVGIMGSGKTSVGKEISKRTGLPLVDTDALIEEQTGMTINDIFALHGEDHFRELETNLLRSLPQYDTPRIISTGGGIIIRPENRQLLRQSGYVAWLDAKLDTLFERVLRHTHRPLLHTPNPKETLRQLHERRRPWYRESSHLIIDTTNLTIEEIAIGIVESSRFHFHQLDSGL